MSEMEFVAIDVETANPDMASICQVGIAVYKAGALADSWGCLVNPQADFSPGNIAVHGLSYEAVRDAPTFAGIADALWRRLATHIVACHTPFDRLCLERACTRFGLSLPEFTWLDTARVVRRAWPEFARSGYGLANVAGRFGIEFRHHDAVEDARATGLLLLKACEHAQITVPEWVHRSSTRSLQARERIARDGTPDGALAGEVIVFTGALTIPRAKAADAAAAAGCRVAANVTGQTTLLVVGDQDLRQTHGAEKSTKHRRAEQLISEGQEIRILQESDFMALISTIG
jgi:DNA polymerase-3 subunit epsilon